MKYKIEYVKRKLKNGYIGMNKQASAKLKVPFKHKHPEHTIVIYKNEPKKVRVHTIRHEKIEEYLIRNKHYSYHKAHHLALKFEQLDKPFPRKDIKRKLIKWGILR